jgi:hypothetical protein
LAAQQFESDDFRDHRILLSFVSQYSEVIVRQIMEKYNRQCPIIVCHSNWKTDGVIFSCRFYSAHPRPHIPHHRLNADDATRQPYGGFTPERIAALKPDLRLTR